MRRSLFPFGDERRLAYLAEASGRGTTARCYADVVGMTTISTQHLEGVRYLKTSGIGGRRVPLMPLWEDERWHLWIPGPNGLLEMNPVSAMETDYVAKTPASDNDIIIPFVELMWQRASFPEICPLIDAIASDFHNLGTSVEKTSHFFADREALGHRCSHFVKTELEYIFMLSRSVFDLLQEAIERLWNNYVSLSDPALEAQRKARKLPPTFSKMVLRDKRDLKTAEDLMAAHALPEALAAAYVAAGPFFSAVRDFRDSIVHGGKDVRFIYVTERGFCIQKKHPGIDRFACWKPEHDDNENITSLLPLIARIVLGTIETCNSLMQAFATQIVLPEPLAPGYRVFIRGPHNEALIWMQQVGSEGSPWWSDRPKQNAS